MSRPPASSALSHLPADLELMRGCGVLEGDKTGPVEQHDIAGRVGGGSPPGSVGDDWRDYARHSARSTGSQEDDIGSTSDDSSGPPEEQGLPAVRGGAKLTLGVQTQPAFDLSQRQQAERQVEEALAENVRLREKLRAEREKRIGVENELATERIDRIEVQNELAVNLHVIEGNELPGMVVRADRNATAAQPTQAKCPCVRLKCALACCLPARPRQPANRDSFGSPNVVHTEAAEPQPDSTSRQRTTYEISVAASGDEGAAPPLPNFTEIDGSTVQGWEQIGRGSGGYVYRAHIGNRRVAIKVPHHWSADAERRLKIECALAQKCKHLNVVGMIGLASGRFGEWSCAGGLVMELCRDSLAGRLQTARDSGNRLMWGAELLPIAIAIASGMQHLHEQGVLHRDLKPENVLLGFDGTAKIADFGLSREYVLNGTMSAGVGSAYFMSPEALNFSRYAEPNDVWGFGCTLVCMDQSAVHAYSEMPLYVQNFKGKEGGLNIMKKKIMHYLYRPSVNDLCPVHDIVVDCRKDASRRPTFMQVFERLSSAEMRAEADADDERGLGRPTSSRSNQASPSSPRRSGSSVLFS